MNVPQSHFNAPGTRLVLLGASNVTRGVSTVVETAHELLGRPLEIFAAIGHGRSYGITSRMLLRGIPGIVECGLWSALKEQPPAARTYALVTDIGNDIIYGVPPKRIAEWVDECIGRLSEHGAEVVLTQLPIGTIRLVRRWQFSLLSAMLFPTRSVTYVKAIAAAEDLSRRVEEIAERHGLETMPLAPAWFGFDPIHIKYRHWRVAWAEIMGRWTGVQLNGAVRPSPARWLRLRRSMPARWTLAGRPMETAQPSCVLPNGTRVWLY